MREYIGIMVDTLAVIVVVVFGLGLLMLLLGGLSLIDLGPGQTIFEVADSWIAGLQSSIGLARTTLFGSHSLSIGVRMVGGALLCALVLEFLYAARGET